jgi:hypothetical protein
MLFFQPRRRAAATSGCHISGQYLLNIANDTKRPLMTVTTGLGRGRRPAHMTVAPTPPGAGATLLTQIAELGFLLVETS